MLTISQLAAYAGVTVRAVRHYHARGLLPEPERDHSGYRRYDASAAVELIKIRTLAEAGVPLARVHELMVADSDELEAAVAEIDRRLRAEIRQLRVHRERIAHLPAGPDLALPAEAVAYLDRLRSLGLSERFVGGERDAWILVAAQVPEHMAFYMRLKNQQLDDPEAMAFYLDVAKAVDGDPDDAELADIADRLARLLDAYADSGAEDLEDQMPDDLVRMLDSMFLDLVPFAPRLLELMEARGWRGWTRLERIRDRRLG
ncbi:MerR family transcriptional regulator [Solicola sp. PLA-1-18]|uniref:MerR family transcriptional regulator n=1 Tax=Solicola sp. PLA-1-18 TaxID=3380532 RepID=UPI003B7F1164